MNYLSIKRTSIARFALGALLFLTACTLNLPQFGTQPKSAGTPGAKTTAIGVSTLVEGSSSNESATSAPTSSASAPDQPGGEVELTAKDFAEQGKPASGLILFTSTSAQPFVKLNVGTVQGKGSERYLWAISADGKRAGRISPDGSGSALFNPGVAGKKSKLVEYGFHLANDKIEAVEPPEDCQDPSQPCSGFQFSPDGSSLAYFSGADSCGQTLTLYSLLNHKNINTWNNAHWAYFFNDGSLVISLGGCDSQTAYLYIPRTGKQAGLEKIGKEYWNPAHTAVIFQVQGKPELQAGLWGFNLETSRVFLWLAKDTVIEDTPIWLNDGQSFVFQHQAYQYDGGTKDFILKSPRQIILMNAWTRAQHLIGFDGRSNYHLCTASDQAPGAPCAQPYGEWLKVQQLPYNPLRFSASQLDKPEVRCALYGLECKDQPVVLAIDSAAAEQFPWEEARVPEATVTPAYRHPDLEHDPLFQDPNMEYAFYIGKDGHTLWYVPRDREPSLWAQDGEGFIYLP